MTQEAFAVYGFGSAGQFVVDRLLEAGRRVAVIIDRAKHGGNYRDIAIVHPDALAAYPVASLDCIIGLHSNKVDLRALHAVLEKIGFREIYSTISIKERGIRLAMPYGYWLDPDFAAAAHAREFEQLAALLADAKSKEILESLLRYREFGDVRNCPQPSLADEYTPADLPRFKGPLRLIDCGAYSGVAIDKFCASGYAIASVVAFEPDPANYAKLSAKNFDGMQACCLPLGVWSSDSQLRFHNDGSMGSAISDAGETVIQCVRGDSLLKNFAPNLIKFDVEGAEIEALKGLEQTIRQTRPNLCVSLYHTPSHLFEIPLLIQGWNLGYRFFIRVHEYNGFGLVLYCLNDALLEA